MYFISFFIMALTHTLSHMKPYDMIIHVLIESIMQELFNLEAS